MRILGSILAIALTLPTLACSSKASCEDVASAARKWAEGSPTEKPDSVQASVIKTCEEDKWDADKRGCMKEAFGKGEEAMEAIMRCELGNDDKKVNKAKEYIEKSKTTEAEQFVRKMAEAARYYYMEDHASLDSLVPAERKFPESVGPTPAKGSCCEQEDGKCIPDPKQWDDPRWRALSFSLEDPHYYSYEFKSGINDEGNHYFEAYAYGDLDCDGTFSTFSMYGQAVEGEVQTSGAVMRENRLE